MTLPRQPRGADTENAFGVYPPINAFALSVNAICSALLRREPLQRPRANASRAQIILYVIELVLMYGLRFAVVFTLYKALSGTSDPS